MTRINGWGCFFLVSLRLLIGWHFLVEGVHKIRTHRHGRTAINTPWSGEAFFREGVGPAAPYYREFLGIDDKPAVAKLRAEGKQLPKVLSDEWEDYYERFRLNYGLDETQRAAAVAKLGEAKAQTASWLAGDVSTTVKKAVVWGTADVKQTVTQRLAEYDAKVKEVEDALSGKLPAFNADVEKARLRTLKGDAARILNDLLADLNARTAAMRGDLETVLSPEQKKKSPMSESQPLRAIDVLDKATMWTHAILGGCLLLGLFSRFASFLLAGFLLQIALIAPPLPFAPTPPGAVGHYLYINLYTIEMFALLALAAIPTGLWFGLDALVYYFRNRKANVRSESAARRRESAFVYPGPRTQLTEDFSMALDLSADEKLYGKANFADVTGDLTRRGFMKSMAVAGGAVAVAGAAGYFGYQKLEGKPVKAALIGTGDEGGVLIGEHNPEFLEIVAVCDIRPSQLDRAYTGDADQPLRKGLKKVYGADATTNIPRYADYKDMLEKEKDVEAVVIATPLISHAPIVIDCLKAGKHVLCEKLMARTIGQCKDMIKAAKENDRILSIGHQRHYSLLYAHAVEVLNTGVLGDIKHIRALWHRNNSWPRLTAKGEPVVDRYFTNPVLIDGWLKQPPDKDLEALKDTITKYGYKSVEELMRWRLYNRTGGGLMAELGSHQLDACSIFLGKVRPLAVSGVGTHSLYGFASGDGKPNPREIDDHVFATYEFPGKNHPQGPNKGTDKDDVVVVTYSSISSNEFESYGECIMGTRGTMIVEKESDVFLFAEKDKTKGASPPPKSASVSVTPAGKPALDAGATWGGPAAAQAKVASTAAVSKGYREEMEDFAYCVKLWGQGMEKERRLPRCHGTVAMADAIIALTSNLSMKNRRRIEFDEKWFDPTSSDVPDAEVKFETV